MPSKKSKQTDAPPTQETTNEFLTVTPTPTPAPAPAPAPAPKKRGRKPKATDGKPKATDGKPKAAEAPKEAATAAPVSEEPVIEEKEPCPVCMDKYTAVLRRPIACPSCQAETCVKCIQNYLINTTDDPHCLHCKHGFDRMFLQRNLSKLYMNTIYAEHRAKILWAREESYLPAAQVKAERVLRGRNYHKTVMKPLYDEQRDVREKIRKLTEHMDRIYGEISYHRHDEQRLLRGEMTREEAHAAGETVEDPAATRRQFSRKCTVPECRGWLSSAWKCGLCDNYTCKDCFIIRGKVQDAHHECNKEDLETANLIRSSCKSCPKCGEAIEKQSGCDMMFCTSCHTPFSWKTMEIITRGAIHNPHYFEWRNRAGAAGAVGAAHAAEPLPCGGMPTDSFIYRKDITTNQYIFEKELRDELINRYRLTNHIEGVTTNQYASHTRIQNTEQYRIQYLLKDSTKEQIQAALQQEERTRERHKAIRDVLDTYLVAAAEQFRIVAENPTLIVAAQICQELDHLRDFINETLVNVHKAYGCTVPIIMKDWSDVDTYTVYKERQRQRQEQIDAADPVIVELKGIITKLEATIRIERRELDRIYEENGYRFPTEAHRKRNTDLDKMRRQYWDAHNKLEKHREKKAAAAAAAAAAAVAATAIPAVTTD